jgi:aminopeptidase-like protein
MMVEEFFTSDRPRYKECQQFFQELNQKIQAANKQNHINNVDIGTIPELGHNGLYKTWQQKATIAVNNNSVQDFWNTFNHTHNLLKIFNKRHFLP